MGSCARCYGRITRTKDISPFPFIKRNFFAKNSEEIENEGQSEFPAPIGESASATFGSDAIRASVRGENVSQARQGDEVGLGQ